MSEQELVLTPSESLPMQQDRRGFLGGSDIASIFGVSPWKSAFELWEEKTAETFIPPFVEPEREKLYRRGKRLEPWVMEMLEEEQGISVLRRNQRYVDPNYPFLACEIDFEYWDDEGLNNGDIKTISPFAAGEWGDEGTDQFPVYYCLQFMHGMGILPDRPKCLVGALIGADDLRKYVVRRDEELIAEIRRRSIAFWNDNVLAKVPPPIQTQQDAYKALKKYQGFVAPGTTEVWESIRRIRGVKEAAKRLKVIEDKHSLAIKQYLANCKEAEPDKLEPDRFTILDASGKAMATVTKQKRAGYSVGPSEYIVLRAGNYYGGF